ncbi:MAG: hypothetical protein HZA91_07565 [Verrucomicrobia bacterium]|nr:hypothetical protein [Verrucomicrobiota bacterium]
MRRGLFLIVLTVWLTGTVAVWLNASNNFGRSKRVLEQAEQTGLAAKLRALPAEDARQAMHHLASEINRSIFRVWDPSQVGLAVVALWLGWPLSSRWRKVALAVALVIALVLTCWITPTVLALGPPLDFAPRDPSPPEFRAFMFYHGLYLVLDGVKMALLAALMVALARERRA